MKKKVPKKKVPRKKCSSNTEIEKKYKKNKRNYDDDLL